jgi:hypothetical protein
MWGRLSRVAGSSRDWDTDGMRKNAILMVLVLLGASGLSGCVGGDSGCVGGICPQTTGGHGPNAQGAAAQADVSRLGNEIAMYFLDWDGTTLPSIAIDSGGNYMMTAGGVSTNLGIASDNVSISGQRIFSDTDWCIAVTTGADSPQVFRYSSSGSLEQGACP